MSEEQPASPHQDEVAAVENVVAGAHDETPPLTPSPPHSSKSQSPALEEARSSSLVPDDPSKPSDDESAPIPLDDVKQNSPSPPELPTSSPSPPPEADTSHGSSAPQEDDSPSGSPAVASTENDVANSANEVEEKNAPSTQTTIIEEENNKPSVANSETTTAVDDESSGPAIIAKDSSSKSDKDAPSPEKEAKSSSSTASTPSKSPMDDNPTKPAGPEQDLKVAAILEINSELIKCVYYFGFRAPFLQF